MTVVYDAGVLIAADRDVRAVWARHRTWLERDVLPVTTAPVVAQASRSARQARLRLFLDTCEVAPFAPADAHPVGALLSQSGTSDVVDAHLVRVAAGGLIVTSDPGDLRVLADCADPRPLVRAV